jgi:TonB family protein
MWVAVLLLFMGSMCWASTDNKVAADEEIVAGRLTHKVDPRYPKDKAAVYGTIVLEITVAKNGKVKDISILSGPLVLAEAAVDAVEGWKFKPYMQNGAAADARQKLAFTFLRGQKTGKLEMPLSPPTLATGVKVFRRADLPPNTYSAGDHGVTAPKALYTPDPEYPEQARSARYQGTCVLSLVVGKTGEAHNIQVIRALGEGLDLKAVEAVKKWKFQPATKDDQPVAVLVTVEVAFHFFR